MDSTRPLKVCCRICSEDVSRRSLKSCSRHAFSYTGRCTLTRLADLETQLSNTITIRPWSKSIRSLRSSFCPAYDTSALKTDEYIPTIERCHCNEIINIIQATSLWFMSSVCGYRPRQNLGIKNPFSLDALSGVCVISADFMVGIEFLSCLGYVAMLWLVV